MPKNEITRREFVKKNSLAGIGGVVGVGLSSTLVANCTADIGVPAILGGLKIHPAAWPVWPQWNPCF
jgi:hypothetical protein